MLEQRDGFLIPVLVLLASCAGEVDDRAASASIVPIKLIGADPIVEVRVNGLPINVHFDIGTGGSLALFPSKLNQIEDKVLVDRSRGGVAQDGPTGGGRPIYQVDLIEIGGLALENARIGEDFHDEAFQKEFTARNYAHGFLGRRYFLEHKIVIDYPKSELTIIPPDAPAEQQLECQGVELPLLRENEKDWGLVSNAVTDIGSLVVVWDTGFPANVVFKKWTDSAGLSYSVGNKIVSETLNINGHDFGPKTFEVWDWGSDRPPFDGFIGYDFFSEHVVCVDFPNGAVFVQR